MTDSKDFLNAVALGRVSLAKTVRSVSGSTVSFADGASADFDVVVFATGFARDVPFIHRSLRPETRGLYKGALVPSEPRVGYCLFVLPFGSHFQVAELQAAWLAEVWSGGLPTPSVADMLRLARRVPVVAAHAKLGEYHRMQYLALLRPAVFPLARWAREDPVRLFARRGRGTRTRCSSGIRRRARGTRTERRTMGGYRRRDGRGSGSREVGTTTKPTRRSKVAVVVAGVTTAAA